MHRGIVELYRRTLRQRIKRCPPLQHDPSLPASADRLSSNPLKASREQLRRLSLVQPSRTSTSHCAPSPWISLPGVSRLTRMPGLTSIARMSSLAGIPRVPLLLPRQHHTLRHRSLWHVHPRMPRRPLWPLWSGEAWSSSERVGADRKVASSRTS